LGKSVKEKVVVFIDMTRKIEKDQKPADNLGKISKYQRSTNEYLPASFATE
jgi:hypothetical protein